ncbi:MULTISPECIES: hypothetical protein [unclassified Streptosporangium]|uniref:hypothetical protein n=1 Tax=Streptosporangium sp. NPDC005286 TaxID=3154463 RepID=UPI0033A21F4A
MPTELLMQGADAYTSLTEVTTTPETDTPEATPYIISLTLGYSIAATVAGSC